MVIWKTGYCEYSIEEGVSQVKVTILHWTASLTEGELSASSYGTVNAVDQNRVYTLAALNAVPESVMTSWVHEVMGEEEVAAVEQSLADNIALQETPTSGGLTPTE